MGRQKQVWLTELHNCHEADNKNVVRVYFDKFGDLYPKKDIYIPYKSFFDGNKSNQYSGCLEYYFTGQNRNKEDEDIFRARSKTLAEGYSINIQLPFDSIFKKSQDLIIHEYTSTLNTLINSGKSKTLVILIHGFNDPNPTGDYQLIRDNIRKLKLDSNYIYLELYWDGLTANNANPGLSKIWGKAQLNTSYVAYTLRRIINLLDQSTKIRFITHSSGGIVATSCLFNTFSKYKNAKTQDYYELLMNTPGPIQNDIRLAMLAPALPGVATFIDFNCRDGNQEMHPDSNNISKVLVGYNKNDLATAKIVGKIRAPRNIGATSLGCDAKNEVKNTIQTLDELGYQKNNPIIPIDFTKHPECKKSEEHGCYYYLQNKDKIETMLNQLFK